MKAFNYDYLGRRAPDIVELLRSIPDEFLRTNEVCALLRVDSSTVRQWVIDGHLEAQIIEGKVRRRYRVTRSGLISFLYRTMPAASLERKQE